MYHHIAPNPDPRKRNLTIRPDTFQGHMLYLSRRGYRTLTSQELLRYIEGNLVLDRKTVLVTMDDGYADNYVHALPVLKKYGINAVVFLITNRTEKASQKNGAVNVSMMQDEAASLGSQEEKEIYLKWELVNDMAASRLVEFHSHTANHVLCSDIRMADLITELRDSKEIIEKELGKPCECLCWPYGAYSKEAVEAAKSVGYKAIFTANPGVVRRYSDPLCINRLKITDGIFMLKVKMTCTNPYLSELFFTIRGFLVACKRWLRRGVSKNQ